MESRFAVTYGPILAGSALALVLSGMVAVQCMIFFKLYSGESIAKSRMVVSIWTLDAAQSTFIIVSLFNYFVQHFGDRGAMKLIPWSIALTVLVTAMQTCLAHLFYAEKIYRSSDKNWWLTAVIVCLASLRLLAAAVATAEMLRFGRWSTFLGSYPRFLFSTGLWLSAGTDIIITVSLCHYLRQVRRLLASSVMKGVFDALTLYTLENGLITCITTIVSLTFWLLMPASTISLSLHFVIGKLYPNSLLVLLNTRKELRDMHSPSPDTQFNSANTLAAYYTQFPHRAPMTLQSGGSPMGSPLNLKTMPTFAYHSIFKLNQVEVHVQQRVERHSADISEADFDEQRSSTPPSRPSLGNRALPWSSLP